MCGGALSYLKDEGIGLPDALSLVTFDDPAWTSFYRPAITTMKTPRAEMARLALDTLLAQLDKKRVDDGHNRERVLALQLTERESVARLG